MKDRREAVLQWDKEADVQGFNVLWGISPGKLNHSWMVYDKNYLDLKALNTDQPYYFSIEAFNENGVSETTKPVQVE